MSEPRYETVLGLDNIPLELPVARLGSRILAALVDYLAVWALFAVWVLATTVVGIALDLGQGWRIALVIAGLFAAEWGYFAGMEVATGGRTLGKRAVRLRVVSRAGGRAGAGALAVRNLVRTVDLLIGALLMACDPLSRRLGDWLGGTLVVHAEPRPREREVVLVRIPPGWEASRVAVAEGLLGRAGELDPGHALNLARRVVSWVERDAPELLAGTPVADDPMTALRLALVAGG